MGTECWHLEYHIGTDMQCTAHVFQISAILFLITSIYYLVISMEINASNLTIIGLWYCYALAGFLYFVSGWFFTEFSYPDVAKTQINRILKQDLSKKSFFQKYFLDNSMLLSMWFLIFGTIPFLVYPVWAMATGTLSILWGVLFVVAIAYVLYIIWFWTVDCFPENLIESMSRKRATTFYDFFSMFNCCLDESVKRCCGEENFTRHHFGSDIQVVLWILVVLTFLSLVSIIYFIFQHPGKAEWYLWFFCTIFFLFGLEIFLYMSYTETMQTNFVWRLLTCQLEKGNPELEYDAITAESSLERGPLIP